MTRDRLSSRGVKGVTPSEEMLSTSHARSRAFGIRSDIKRPKRGLSSGDLPHLLKKEKALLEKAAQVITPFYYSGELREHLYILTDRELTILNIYADQDFFSQCTLVGMERGISLTEESCGTNAFSLAKMANHMIVLGGSDHYAELFDDWWSVAGPIRDLKRRIAGYLGLILPHGMKSESAIGLLKTLIDAMEIRGVEGDTLYPKTKINKHRREFAPSLMDQIGEIEEDQKRLLKVLTKREQEILPFLLQRWTSQEIAEELHLSVSTIRKHRQNIYQKTRVRSIQELLTAFASKNTTK
ncbi:LuxR family transcriptional regulator [Thermicanus aegyptius]|uniref:LuxR family transcriptional regulator n=1 Tax=Thermicanus aegyptius TaxID=94009 RepID=UPI000A05A6AA|nr:LuxR C-terminal-related transcriptional regulator [Thermicanus aegyptius]